jgi:hypothetical protein
MANPKTEKFKRAEKKSDPVFSRISSPHTMDRRWGPGMKDRGDSAPFVLIPAFRKAVAQKSNIGNGAGRFQSSGL